ncbi:phosphocholine cytidylyltransferase family protein [Candidatus Woesearchaeota archaeon]|nr:phosphocholine cytidylyltransferase family protein [Candidatus Woesearchaeota archaeon]
MKAIILAAGMGTRLGKYTKDLPKCMLKFSGKTLLERQIETLRNAGIRDISIVTGYMAEKINYPGVKYYKNKDFATTNMVESLFCAVDEMTDDLVVCYGDIVYQKSVIDSVMQSKADIGVTVDLDYWPYWAARLSEPEKDIESLVVDKNGKIIDLGNPDCSLEEAKVRYVGLIRFSKKGLSALKKVYSENKKKYFSKDAPWLRSKSFKKAYMTCMLQAMINAGYKVMPIPINRGWLEFDTSEDYEKMSGLHKSGRLKQFIKLDA